MHARITVRVIHQTATTTNRVGLANSAARLLPAGTVCLSRTASVGYVVSRQKARRHTLQHPSITVRCRERGTQASSGYRDSLGA
jgi:hypothetical protein